MMRKIYMSKETRRIGELLLGGKTPLLLNSLEFLDCEKNAKE